MVRGNRILLALVFSCMLIAGFNRAARAADSKVFTIAGFAGVDGAKMVGLPGNVVTDKNGAYSARVPSGWSGRVTPTKPGFVFEPYAREYEPINESFTKENFTATKGPFVISGTVGLAGVKFKSLPGEPVSDDQGRFAIEVPNDLAGYVMPIKEGYAFDPPFVAFGPTSRIDTVHFTPRALTFTISGRTGVAGVLMKGLPREPVTDREGFYKAQLPFGWMGVVVPQKEGFNFTPPERTYRSVEADLSDENYTADERMATISNVIKSRNEPIQGVKVTAQPGGYTAVTDSQGRYRLEVPYGWSGRLGLSKPGFDFVGEVEFSNVTADIVDGKSVPASEEWPSYPPGASQGDVAVPATDVLVIPRGDTTPEKIAETAEDLRVMLQILREKLSEPRMILGVLRDYGSLLGDDRRAEAIYLQGSAALFVIGADFPPSSPPQQAGEGEAPSRPQGEAADPVWQRARQKLYSSAAVRSAGQPGQTQAMTFEQFKEELLRSLKHAANIRHIDPNELVVLTLVAQKEGASRVGDADMMRQYENIYGSDHAAMMGVSRPAPSTTVLTMQAKKSDIDAFAQGTLDFDQFRRKVRSIAY